MKQINGQLDLFSIEFTEKVKACDCGNTKLCVKVSGCGIPHDFKNKPLVYDQYLYSIFCPQCLRVAGCNIDGWRSNKTDMEKALSDWNTYERVEPKYEWVKISLRKAVNEFINYHSYYPSITDTLGISHIYTGVM